MIHKTLKTTQGKLKVAIPTSLDEITLGQMIELQEKPLLNDLDAISILSGVSVTDLQNVVSMDDLQAFSGTVLILSEQIKYLYNSDDIPKTITFNFAEGSKTVNVIRNLAIEPAGAFMAARDIIADEISAHIEQHGDEDWEDYFNPSLKACSQVLAHYFYCRATEKLYNEYAAEEFNSEIKKLRVTEALPIAKHFFTCYPNLSKQKTDYFHRLLHNWRKRLAYSRFKSLSISIQ